MKFESKATHFAIKIKSGGKKEVGGDIIMVPPLFARFQPSANKKVGVFDSESREFKELLNEFNEGKDKSDPYRITTAKVDEIIVGSEEFTKMHDIWKAKSKKELDAIVTSEIIAKLDTLDESAKKKLWETMNPETPGISLSDIGDGVRIDSERARKINKIELDEKL